MCVKAIDRMREREKPSEREREKDTATCKKEYGRGGESACAREKA